ncbi:hypothetical protein B0H19DRAFT_1255219 [Mycena capillaripes]|nr:hypothetical protein B0H19DRAFT_1255219 [Mycena capillaripes]
MPPQSTGTERLNNITASLNVTADTLKVLADAVKTPFLGVISNTTGSLMQCVKTIKQNKSDCAQLMEQTHELLNTIVMVHVNSPTGGELPATMLKQIGKFTETLHKIHTFVEAQQSGSKIKSFFRQGEMTALLKDCEEGLQQGLEFFQVQAVNIMKDVKEMEKEAKMRHQDVLNMIEGLSDTTSSDGASSINRVDPIVKVPTHSQCCHQNHRYFMDES